MTVTAHLHMPEINTLIAQGAWPQAQAKLEAALAKNAGFFLYHERLGDVLREQGQRDGAARSYGKALACNGKATWIRGKIDRLNAAPSQQPSAPTPAPEPAPDPTPTIAQVMAPASTQKFAALHDRFPDLTGKRLLEGGRRLRGDLRQSRPGEPLVTIVTAVYDNTTTFQRCIDSIKAQTWGNVEYIVVDGASPQGTRDIIAANDDFIDYYISEPDAGIYAAMNKGIALARGDYVCLLNSDDRHDPDFVTRSLERALAVERETGETVDIVYSDFWDGDTLLPAQSLSPGLLFGNLNVSHCTFLVRRDCYDAIGPYSEELKIVSDMVWMRKAYTEGKRFELLSEAFFRFYHGGASSGNSPERRKLIIWENGHCYRQDFPFLTQEEAETIYLLRFSNDRLAPVSEMIDKYGHHPRFFEALARYVEHCFRDRGAFALPHTEAGGKFLQYIDIAERLGVDKRHIRIATAGGCLSKILGRIADMPRKPHTRAGKRVLHYVTVFSAGSETFIYDLVNRLQDDTVHDNIVLYQEPQLRSERPYAKEVHLSWPEYRPEVSAQIYKYILDSHEIDLIIAHFAINEHRLHERIGHLGLTRPTIVMTHGVDVFAIHTKPEYGAYVTKTLVARDDVAFTAVSKYLRNALIDTGVPPEKITELHNTVNPRFLAHRKTGDFYDRSRPLRLVSVGRLIRLKGHRFLLDALADFTKRATQDVELSLVYGNGDDELVPLQAQVERLGLTDKVRFVPFVNFAREPDYLARFDCYIHASTYSEDAVPRSESFGVSVLEAVAAGLAVITTNAGGLAEVVGQDGDHARIVPHADANALADAMVDLYNSDTAFTDNLAYAEQRLATFSATSQITILSQLMHKVTGTQLRAGLFSSATTGGAGYAAYRVHRGLRDTSIAPEILTTVRTHEKNPGVRFVPHPSGDGARWRTMQLQAKPGHTIFTVNQTNIHSADLVKMVEDYDVIAVHWHARFLSVENIATLTHLGKPVVMTIRDMQPLTGGCHFFHGCDKWKSDCAACPQITSAYTDYPAKILAAKQANIDFSNLTIVTLSNHTRGIVQQSPGFNTARLETIPNSIETDVFRPYDKKSRRREFGLPLDRKIIGYVPSYSSEVKGYREIMAAFEKLRAMDPGLDPFIMLVGPETPASHDIAYDKKSVGFIDDNDKLARAYSCADLVVVPSLEETFSNTAAEAVACGVPLVGFKTGAIPDLAIDGVTGYTYPVGDVDGLTRGIHKVLTGPDLSKNCRTHAEAMLSFMTQARRYETLFHELAATNLRALDTGRRPSVFTCFEEPTFDLVNIALEKLAGRS